MKFYEKWPNWLRWLLVIPILLLGLLIGGFLGIFTYFEAMKETFYIYREGSFAATAISMTAVTFSICFSCSIAPKHKKTLSIIFTIFISICDLVLYLNHFVSIHVFLGALVGGLLAMRVVFIKERDKLNAEKIEDWKEEVKDDISLKDKISLCKNYTFSSYACPSENILVDGYGIPLSICGILASFIISGFISSFLNNCLNNKLYGNPTVYIVTEIILLAFFTHLLIIFNNLHTNTSSYVQYFKDEKGNYYEITFLSRNSARTDSNKYRTKRMEDFDNAHNLEEAFNAVDRYKKGIKEWNAVLDGNVKVIKLEEFKLIRKGRNWSVYSYMKNGRKRKKRISSGFEGLADALQEETSILK